MAHSSPSTLSKITNKWKALPGGYKAVAGTLLFLLGAATITAGVIGIMACPPALALLPVLGKLSLPLIVGAATAILSAAVSLFHLIHIAITPGSLKTTNHHTNSKQPPNGYGHTKKNKKGTQRGADPSKRGYRKITY